MTARDDERSARLYDDGLQRLREGRFDEALEIAAELEAAAYSGAFELRALVLAAQGDKEEAVACLQEGLTKAPDVWTLWQLHGNLSSDLGHFDEARASYERGLRCPDAHRDSLVLNQAILDQRQEDHHRSLERLDRIEDPELWAQVASTRLTSLLELEHLAMLRRVGEAFLARLGRGDEGDAPSIAHALATLALAAKRRGRPVEEAEVLALRGLGYHVDSDHLLWVLREVRSHYSEDAHLWRMVLEGQDGVEGTAGFYVVHRVVADTAYEALELAREIQRAQGFESLEIDDYTDEGARPELPKGVYDVPGRIYYGTRD